MTVAQKMRVTAGVLYTILSIYQMLLTFTVTQAATPSNSSMVWMAAIYLIIGAAAMAIWMFAKDTVFTGRTRAAVAVGTLLVIAFELIHWSEQTNVINYTLANLLPGLYDQRIVLYFFVVGRLMLLILGAFFVISCSESMDYKGGTKEKADVAAPAAAGAVKASAAPDLDKPLAVSAPEDDKKAEKKAEKAEKADEKKEDKKGDKKDEEKKA